MTSHDAVSAARRWSGQATIGHTGTLDPGAAGVLVLAVGRATRLARYILEGTKAYRAEMTLGVKTATQDAAGEVTATADATPIGRELLEAAIRLRVGQGYQVPPMVSAIKRDGVPLYRLARRGEEVVRAPRPITFYRIDLLEFRPGRQAVAMLDVECSAGTYIRTLCADLGDDLGVGAHLSFLVRTASGPFRLEDACTLEELSEEGMSRWLLPPAAGVTGWPKVVLGDADARRMLHGRAVTVDGGPHGTVQVIDGDGRLLAMAEARSLGDGRRLWPRVVLGS
ncbi:MAG TPA: tRNA pseudouridine(55) synthase TruB [Clostridiales bacterium]|nr:tRNA pseudouridine(55) synthase TruB [Clostridiales bacterium]